MNQFLGQIALIVANYDEAIAYYTKTLQFQLLEDTDRGNGKR
jgi:catechol 2,3-dioxygenase-like lactoylglutathione lyase family enzyme